MFPLKVFFLPDNAVSTLSKETTSFPFSSLVGNEVYNFYEEKNDDKKRSSFHLFEIYKDSAALDLHRNTSYYKNYRLKIAELLEKPIEVKIFNSIDSV